MDKILKAQFVQNAEFKNLVTPKVTGFFSFSSLFGINSEQIAASFAIGNRKYTSTFAEDIISICNEKGIVTDGQFQKATCTLRINYSRLKNNRYYVPKKETMFAIFIGFELDIETVTTLMNKGGTAFIYDEDFEKRTSLPSYDRLIHDCICAKNYDIEDINAFLEKNGYGKRLGSKSLL